MPEQSFSASALQRARGALAAWVDPESEITASERLTSIWQLIGAGGDTRNKGLCGRRGRKYFGDATHPKDKDAQKLPPKMLAAGFVATSGVKRTAGGHRFWRETGTRPIVRLTSGGRGHGNDGFDVRFWLLQCKGLL
jgi:hypothetical protein